ncbi:MAG: TPM domain-containing protein [Gallionella sp.]|nr:TPM domain-containing protein [Gallionella sp.]
MNLSWARVILLALLLVGAAQAEVAVPPLAQRITDLTATLDAGQIQTLEARLAAFEAKKGVQLAVLIVPTTQPEAIEQFGIRVVDAWKLGRKNVDDGALLLVAKEDRTLRIEVGYGLEGVLNDATAHRIIDEIIVPHFKRGEFYSGIESGLTAMMQVVNGEPLPPPPRRSSANKKFDFESLLFIAFGLVVVVGGMLRALLGRFPAAVLMGGALGVLAWLMVAPLLVALLIGFMAFVFVLLGGAGRGIGGHGRGGFGGGGFSGGGGGFSGGGGGFGGGGASGRW